MTPTDEIRAKLDELGIEWWHDDDISPGHTEWMTDDAAYTSLGMDGDMLSVKVISKITPEQAIAATVGDGEGSRDEWRSVALGLFGSLEKADLEVAQRWLCENDLLRQEIAYGDAKAATAGVAREEVATREQESIVCDFLRKISPERDWMYLGEVEHALISEMVRTIAATMGAGTCTMEPDGYYGEQYGIYKCSNCGELWQFEVEGPKENGWTCCPHCLARIKEETE